MKLLGINLTVFGFLMLMVLGLPGPSQAQYLGEVIWTATITEKETGPVNPPETVTVKAGITRIGGDYYSIQGQVVNPDPLIFSGGGVLIGDTLFGTCSTSQRHSNETWRDTGILHVELNRNTLNGSFFEVGQDFDTAYRNFSPHYTAGTLTRTGGIGKLTTAGAATQLLLLEKE